MYIFLPTMKKTNIIKPIRSIWQRIPDKLPVCGEGEKVKFIHNFIKFQVLVCKYIRSHPIFCSKFKN